MSSQTAGLIYLEAPTLAGAVILDDTSTSGIFIALRRHIWTVIIIVLLITTIACIVFQILSSYATTVSVKMQTRSSGLQDVQAIADGNENDINIAITEPDIVRLNDFAPNVVEALYLDQNSEFVSLPQDLARILTAVNDVIQWISGAYSSPAPLNAAAMPSLLNMMTLTRKDLSKLISITIQTRDPTLSVKAADAYAN